MNLENINLNLGHVRLYGVISKLTPIRNTT